MSQATVPAALDGLLDPRIRCLDAESAKRVIEFRVAPEVEARVAVLAEKANEGTLDEAERSEYEALIETAEIVSILQLKAQRQLQDHGR